MPILLLLNGPHHEVVNQLRVPAHVETRAPTEGASTSAGLSRLPIRLASHPPRAMRDVAPVSQQKRPEARAKPGVRLADFRCRSQSSLQSRREGVGRPARATCRPGVLEVVEVTNIDLGPCAPELLARRPSRLQIRIERSHSTIQDRRPLPR